MIPSRRALRRRLGQRVVVHTRDDRTIDGILVGTHVEALALASAVLLQPGEQPDIPLGGETLIPHENISLVQVGLS